MALNMLDVAFSVIKKKVKSRVEISTGTGSTTHVGIC